MSRIAVIPARYASSRFPGKPLALIQGKPMIQHVWERVSQVASIDRVIVATDDERIVEAVRQIGAEVQLTDPNHPSGTDRVWEVAKAIDDAELIVNVQGDEPFIESDAVEAALNCLMTRPQADIATLVTPIADEAEWLDPNAVKAVLSADGQALYFSRAPIPFNRKAGGTGYVPGQGFRHLGLYVYRREALARWTSLPPSPLEQSEQLEQLRALEAGMRFDAVCIPAAPIGVDTPADLERLLLSLG
jgi:3-deoxy-manno-octulosonate cytidylyltransferase (CMP-KDO synthetase)